MLPAVGVPIFAALTLLVIAAIGYLIDRSA
jgi:hypothetical protein